jgi:hypothetical protein
MKTENDHSTIQQYNECDQPLKIKTVLITMNACRIYQTVINANLVEGVLTLILLR